MPTTDTGREQPRKDGPTASAIPSFESLRDPRRRSAVDLLGPPAPLAVPVVAPAPPAVPSPPALPSPPDGGPRPAEYADLLHLGLRVASAVVGASGRLAMWSVEEALRSVRWLLGDQGPRSSSGGPARG